MSDQRTEAATPRRRQRARHEGQVPRSQDLSATVGLLAWLGAAAATAPSGLEAFAGTLSQFLGTVGADRTGAAFTAALGGWTWAGVRLVAPMFLASAVAGAIATLAQTGGTFSAKPLEPKLSRLNPLEGCRRLLSARSAVEAAKSVVKIAALAYVVWGAVRASLPALLSAGAVAPQGALGMLGRAILDVAARGALTLLVIAALDVLFQRWQHERSLRMTKQEVREDYKETEGDPIVKSRQRARAREMARRRMMADVPKATVVVTNPVHFAVALRYVPGEMAAPVVVAKGTRLVAQRIKQLAARYDVPVVENRPLARALYKTVKVGRPIPPALYHAVAEVLAAIYRARRRPGRTA
jgi:flagellar biosynthetic protein FlhB